jgi:CRISPR-associated protein Cas1
MPAMTLIVDRRNARLATDGRDVVRIDYPDGSVRRVGLRALRCLVVQGDVTLTAPLLRACEAAGVGLVLMPGRGRGQASNLLPHTAWQEAQRRAQARCHLDPDCRLSLARRLVAKKIQTQQGRLATHGKYVELDRFAEHALRARDHGELMGVEGAAGARYFAAWGETLDPRWHFPGRNRRPPRDPVNALLSLAYTLAGQHVGRLAASRGLDDAFPFLHVSGPHRPALMLDLLEPVRPWVDEWVRDLLRDPRLTPERFFTRKDLGCRLDKDGRTLFYAAWYAVEDAWLSPPARRALALALAHLRPLRG